MLKRLFLRIKLQILHNLCIRCIVLLDFLYPLILLFSFSCHLAFISLIYFCCIYSNIVVLLQLENYWFNHGLRVAPPTALWGETDCTFCIVLYCIVLYCNTTTGHQGCHFIPDKSYGRSMSDMKSVKSLIVPSLHIGILPQELNLEK